MLYFLVNFLIKLEPVRGKVTRNTYTYRETHSTEKEMKDHSQPEDSLNNKEGEGSAAEKLMCLYFCTGQFAQNYCFMIYFFRFLQRER